MSKLSIINTRLLGDFLHKYPGLFYPSEKLSISEVRDEIKQYPSEVVKKIKKMYPYPFFKNQLIDEYDGWSDEEIISRLNGTLSSLNLRGYKIKTKKGQIIITRK